MRLTSVFIFLILISAIFLAPLSAGGFTPPQSEGLPPVIDGDWIISSGESVSLEHQSLEIKGNVIIQSGGSLTLSSGSSLIVNSSYDGQFGIYVKRGATFNVINSKVTGVEKDYRGNISYNLTKGMNFISIPFERDNNSVKQVLAPFQNYYYKAMVYDSSNSTDPWKYYVAENISNYGDYKEQLPAYFWSFETANRVKPDLYPPSVLFTAPVDGTYAEVDQPVICIFNESMNSSVVPTIKQTKGILDGDFEFEGWRSIFSKNDTAIWSHKDWFETDSITIEISHYSDIHGNFGQPMNFSFTVDSGNTPHVKYSVPYSGDQNANPEQEFKLVFDKSMNSSATPTIVDKCSNQSDEWTFLGWTSTNQTYDTATWSHPVWKSGSEHLVCVSNYTDNSGNSGPEHYVFFKVKDTVPPVITGSYPQNSSFSVDPNSNVRVLFSETMNSSSIPTIVQTGGTDPGNWTFLGWRSTYDVNDTAIWSHDRWKDMDNITLTLSNYSDISGNKGDIYSWSFRTGDHRAPRVLDVYPPVFSRSISPTSEIRVVFNSSMNQMCVPSIKDNIGTDYIFEGWNTTHFPHDTAVWSHANWSKNISIRISISNYSDLSKISYLDGIYLYMKSPLRINITGTVNAYPSSVLYRGWNAIGYPFIDPSDTASIFSSIRGNYDHIKTYSGDEEVYLNSTDLMQPGHAYWIHITDRSLWSVSAYSLSGLENLFPRFGWIYENGSSGNIQNSLIAGCGYESPGMGGLSIHSDMVKVSNTEFRNGYYGIYIKDSSPIISQSTIHVTHYGIVSDGASPILSNNDIFSNRDGGILIREGFPIIAYNNIYSNEGNGISLYNSTAVLDSNTIAGNRVSGIYLENSSARVGSQIIKGNDVGIQAFYSNISVFDSTFKYNRVGTHSSFSHLNITSGNDFSNETLDIYADNRSTGYIMGNSMSSSERAHINVQSNSNIFIYGNILISGDTGIYVSGATANITNNIIAQNLGSGVHLNGCKGVNIDYNTISGNGWAGIYLESSSSDIDGNSIYSNDFGIASFSSDPIISNNTISRNRWYGASLVYSDVVIENTRFLNNRWYGILSSYSKTDIWNSTVFNSTYQLYLTHNSRTNSINSTIAEDHVHLDFTSLLYVKYLLRMNLRDTLGNRISGVSYSISDRNNMPVVSGNSSFGVQYIPLTSRIITYTGATDAYAPYTLSVSWNGDSYSDTFYMNASKSLNFTFRPVEHSIYEDSGKSPIASMSDWFPPTSDDNVTFEVHSTPGVMAYVNDSILYVIPSENWNGMAHILVDEVSDNRTIWNCTFLLKVIAVNDPPKILGETQPKTSGKTTVFTVVYSDVENQAPEYVRVVIDGKPHEMYPENSGDTDYVDGRTYIYKTELSPGEHRYHYSVSDGNSTVSTKDVQFTVEHTFDFFTYGVLALLVAGLLVVLAIAYRIRKLKKISSDDDDLHGDSYSSAPFALRGSALDKRRSIPSKDLGMDMPEDEERSTMPASSIDRSVSEGAEDEKLSEVLASPVAGPAVQEEIESPGSTEEPEEPSEPSREPKYGRSRYLEMTRKHRKMRVPVEDRDKYKLSPSLSGEESPEPEEDVDDILRAIKGD